MFLADYHIHSYFSNDSDAPLEDLVKTAIERGASEIAITDHHETIQKVGPFLNHVYQIDKWTPQYPIWTVPTHDRPVDYRAVKKEIDELNEKYKGKIYIVYGIEAGQAQANPDEVHEIVNSHPFDFVLASTHTLENDLDLFFIDFSKCDAEKVYGEYLERLHKCIDYGNFDVMAHVNYAGRYIVRDTGIKYDYSIFEEQFREIFKRLAHLGKGIEINTSGLFQGLDEPIPSLWLLKVYRDCGGEIVTVGSDARFTEHVTRGVRFSYEMMKIAGFSAVATFRQRNVRFIDLD